MAAAGGFGEPPLSSLPLPTGGDDELFSPSAAVADGNQHLVHPLHMHQLDNRHQTCCDGADGADISPTYDKAPYMREMEKTIEGSRFCAQHVKNKDKFESVSTASSLHLQPYNTKHTTHWCGINFAFRARRCAIIENFAHTFRRKLYAEVPE